MQQRRLRYEKRTGGLERFERRTTGADSRKRETKVSVIEASIALQRVLQFSQSFLTLALWQGELHQPEVLSCRTIFEFISPSTSQNLNDSLADDEGSGLCENIQPNDAFTEWMRHRDEM